MAIEFVSGDVFADETTTAYAHGCNCAGAMGKGIAVQFKKRWPKMYQEYRRLCLSNEFVPGDVFVWEESGKTVFNMGTQRTWRAKASIPAIEKAVSTMVKMAEERGLEYVVLPQIGAGLGGLKWVTIRSVLESIAASTDVRLIVCEAYNPGERIDFVH